RLAEWRYAVVLPDVPFACVVGGDGEIGVTVERLEQPAQVAHAAVDVGDRIVRVGDPETLCGGGHELHQAAGALVGDLARVEVGLRFDHRRDERGIDV